MSKLYVMAGGDDVYVFENEEAAGLQALVMIGANLDVEEIFKVTPEKWAEARPQLEAQGINIIDTRDDQATTDAAKDAA